MTLIAWRPRAGSVCRIIKVKKDAADTTTPPGTWMILDRHPAPGSWWLRPCDVTAKQWAAEHPAEAKDMYRHASRLVSSREPQ
ncbi:MAG: hypothetical protein JWO67_4572 [Streptosporangiaceae bacterium]|nr:hypothetical protein [Streptosporangiaceae bacterium]